MPAHAKGRRRISSLPSIGILDRCTVAAACTMYVTAAVVLLQAIATLDRARQALLFYFTSPRLDLSLIQANIGCFAVVRQSACSRSSSRLGVVLCFKRCAKPMHSPSPSLLKSGRQAAETAIPRTRESNHVVHYVCHSGCGTTGGCVSAFDGIGIHAAITMLYAHGNFGYQLEHE